VSLYDVPNFDNPLCAQTDPDLFFTPDLETTKASTNFAKAKKICSSCSFREPCSEYALHNRVDGVWGGLSENERIVIRKLRGIVPRNIASTPMLNRIREIGGRK